MSMTFPEKQSPRGKAETMAETATMLKQGTARKIVTLQILIGASQSTMNSASGLFPQCRSSAQTARWIGQSAVLSCMALRRAVDPAL